ncbi:hypothetical protein ADU59_07065 [Pararhizobium polonicum]|uniref:TonB C-terminal domain-containing protein n=2 Tax=Pararhizobium polonicum TaxID=1612624 RepID=A0A1C7P4B7_9HYPH|nr:hypothetical protein ADU59_07065 [Pararhizobium polonicum]
MRTDANGRHVSTFIKNSSGNEEADKVAVRAASLNFRRQVKKPLKNHNYVIEVNVLEMADPAWGSDKPK